MTLFDKGARPYMKLLAVGLVVFTFSACKEGNKPGPAYVPPPPEGQGAIDNSGNTLSCNNLNPRKVYAFGYLNDDTAHQVLFDLEEPSNFCAGFPVAGLGTGGAHDAVVGPLGELAYNSSGSRVYAMVPDSIIAGNYPYSGNNDTEIADFNNCDPDNFDYLTAARVFSDCGNSTDYYEDGRAESTTFGKFLTLLGNGEILAFDRARDVLVVGNIDGTSRDISIPASLQANWLFFGSRRIGSDQAWLAFAIGSGGDRQYRRYRVNATTSEFIDEGEFAALDAEIDISSQFQVGHGVLDGDGDLWHSFVTANSGYTVVYERPFSSTESSTLVYTTADPRNDRQNLWYDQVYVFPIMLNHIQFPGSSDLVTGR